jgi:hypothetical protein
MLKGSDWEALRTELLPLKQTRILETEWEPPFQVLALHKKSGLALPSQLDLIHRANTAG